MPQAAVCGGTAGGELGAVGREGPCLPKEILSHILRDEGWDVGPIQQTFPHLFCCIEVGS